MKTTDQIIKIYVFVQPGELTMAFKFKKIIMTNIIIIISNFIEVN